MLSAKDFHKPCNYNSETKDQLWCSIIADAHDSNCGCNWPFAHLLCCLFPPGHKDRDLTINQILHRDYTELCHSGGDAERDSGGQTKEDTDAKGDGQKEEEKGYIKDEELEQLIAAAEGAGTR